MLAMVDMFNLTLATGHLPAAGGLLDQDWEIVLAYQVLARHFGGIADVLARRQGLGG